MQEYSAEFRVADGSPDVAHETGLFPRHCEEPLRRSAPRAPHEARTSSPFRPSESCRTGCGNDLSGVHPSVRSLIPGNHGEDQ